MTRLMVLGGGRHQIPLIRRAQDRGIDVVLVDYLSDAPGRDIASIAELADAADPEAAIRLAKEHRVDGVITTGTDIPIHAMATVAEALDLPSYLSAESARVATDKEAMFETLRELGIRMAARGAVDFDRVRGVPPLPVVVKPADSQGQRGLSLVSRPEELERAIAGARAASKSKRVIIEQFIEGPEFTANAWLQDGDLTLLLVNDRITFNPRPFVGIAFQHRFPSQAADPWHAEVANVIAQIAIAYGMKTGPLYVQMIATDAGPMVVEAAARVGGGHESRLLLHMNGWSTDDALIDIALGQNPTPPPPLPKDSHTLVNFILGSSGTIDRLVQPDLKKGIVEAAWYVRPGARLANVTDSLGRIGYFIARADTSEQLLERSEVFYRSLKALSPQGINLVHTPDPATLNLP